jgi:hypothetical protein
MTDMLNQIYGKQWKTSAVESEAPVSAQFAEVPEAACCLILRRPNNLVNQIRHTRMQRRRFLRVHGKAQALYLSGTVVERLIE